MVTLLKTLENSNAKDVASHASTPASILHRLSKHRDVRVRIAVADNQNTGAITSTQLAQDDNADLRYAMAENHHIPRNILDILATDTNPFVADRAQKTITRLKQATPLVMLMLTLKKCVRKTA